MTEIRTCTKKVQENNIKYMQQHQKQVLEDKNKEVLVLMLKGGVVKHAKAMAL